MHWERAISGTDELKNVFTKTWIDMKVREDNLRIQLHFSTRIKKVENVKNICEHS